MDIKNTVPESSKRRATVRFTEEEYERLVAESYVTGKSIPILLKEIYFAGRKIIPLMNAEDQKSTLTELRRIGNNINQIARHLNAGFMDSCRKEFLEVRDNLAALKRFVGGYDGDRKDILA